MVENEEVLTLWMGSCSMRASSSAESGGGGGTDARLAAEVPNRSSNGSDIGRL
jgi:hypothetical protein